MAKILGESGRYVSDEAVRQRERVLVTLCIMIGLLGLIEGVVISCYIPLSWLRGVGRATIFLIAAIAIWAIDKWGDKKLTTVEKKKENFLRGATGEIHVGKLLT